MKTVILYIVALAFVVIGFSLALAFAKLALLSALFMLLALATLGWLTHSLIRKVRRTRLRLTS